jgi:hydroxymethylpyrimidine pyrophosphatase-like HAD family hydrolase
VCRIVVVAPDQREQDFIDLVAGIGLNQVSYAVGWTAWLDIAPMGVDKSTGLEIVRHELGIDPAHVLVIGDGRNDLGMFRWAREQGGRAVAMEQGPQEVRDAAGEITSSVEAGGVAAVLRKL